MKPLLTVFLFGCISLFAAEGVIDVASDYNVSTTADRFESILHKKGITVFARIDHAAAAQKVGQTLRPTELVIFGNPKVGSPLIQCAQRIAIDLPQKALVWQDDKGKVWLSYNDPEYLKRRHAVKGCDKVFAKIEKALAGLAKAATE